MHGAHGAFAQARRIFHGGAAVGHRHVVQLFHLFRGVALEADGAAVGAGGRLAVERLGDRQGVAVVAVEQPHDAGSGLVTDRLAGAEHAEYRVVEPLGTFDIVGTDHDVVEHVVSLPFLPPALCRLHCFIGWMAQARCTRLRPPPPATPAGPGWRVRRSLATPRAPSAAAHCPPAGC